MLLKKEESDPEAARSYASSVTPFSCKPSC